MKVDQELPAEANSQGQPARRRRFTHRRVPNCPPRHTPPLHVHYPHAATSVEGGSQDQQTPPQSGGTPPPMSGHAEEMPPVHVPLPEQKRPQEEGR